MKPKIIIADDDEFARDMVVEYLADECEILSVCTNGAEAVDSFQEFHKHLDVLFLDMIMPKLTGYQVYKSIQEISPGFSNIIIMSGCFCQEEVDKMLKTGCFFIQKPFLKYQLVDLMMMMMVK